MQINRVLHTTKFFDYVQIKKVIYVKGCILSRIDNRHPLKF